MLRMMIGRAAIEVRIKGDVQSKRETRVDNERRTGADMKTKNIEVDGILRQKKKLEVFFSPF